ncbi:DoxX family protein [Micromonospora sp. C95]|uniref:DoxX family protein n=1 Tax=Micromonospora sp. C95 TaxID=2824882 RepID=UPI001B3894F9|nr:DoxX family protein [Micromonospora sp. C95]MBQ1025043.1 DoxX family protein [Micromonospora sp. C95]
MTTPGRPPTATVRPRRQLLTGALWCLQVLLAAVFISVAVAKLSGAPSSVQTFDSIGLGQWLRYLTGAVELAGGVGLLVPRLATLAGLGMACVMVGASVANLLVLAPAMTLVTILLGVASVVVAVGRWPTGPGSSASR